MMRHNKEDHQAAKLEQLFEDINNNQTETKKTNDTSDTNEEHDIKQTVDILNLPPRREIHKNKNRRTRLKVKKPFIRIAIVIFVLVGILGFAYYLYMNEWLLFTIFS